MTRQSFFGNTLGLVVATETLELEKVFENQNKPGGDAFDDLLEDTKDAVTQAEKPPEEPKEPEAATDAAQAPTDEDGASGERVTGDTEVSDSSPTDVDSTNDEDKDEEPKKPKAGSEEEELLNATKDDKPEKEPDISAESLRHFMSAETHRLLKALTPSFEDYSDSEYGSPHHEPWAQHSGNPAANPSENHSQTWNFAANVGRWLVNLGIKITTDMLPRLSKATYKGVLYAFNRLGYNFSVGMAALEQYMTRRMRSFDRLHAELSKAHEALELLKKPTVSDLKGRTYSAETVIRHLVVSDSPDLNKHVGELTKFLGTTVQGLGKQIATDIGATRQIISQSHLGTSDNLYKLLEVDIQIPGMKPGALPGYEKQQTGLMSFYTTQDLPGNVSLIAHLPDSKIQERDIWVQAYRDSEIFLGVDKAKFKAVMGIPFMDIQNLETLIKQLQALCQSCLQHQTFYESLRKQKILQKQAYKNYFDDIVRRGQRVSIKETLIDLVLLKNNLIDKVYLPAAIDVHDYAARTISAYLRFVEKNIRELSP